MRQVSDDPVVRAMGFLWAAAINLNAAATFLPIGHPEGEKLAKLAARVEAMHERLAIEEPNVNT